MEEWRKIEDFPRYSVSNKGRIRNDETGKLLTPTENKKSKYQYVQLGKRNNKTVHRLVAKAFIDNQENKRDVNHKDGNKSNNDVSNLEWNTPSENNKHAYKTGLKQSYRPPNAGVDKAKVRVVETGVTYNSVRDCARAIGCSQGHISDCLRGRCHKHHNYHFERVADKE